MFLILGILSALWERNLSNKGQVIDAAMVEGVPALMGLIHSYISENKWKNERSSNLLDGGCPYYKCYETRDGRYISVGAIENKFFAILVKKLNLNETWVSEQNNEKKWPQLSENLSTIFLTKTRDEWGQIFDGTDACVEPVLTFEEIEDHPHNIARKIFFRKNSILQANPAPNFSRTPAKNILNSTEKKPIKKVLKDWGINEF